MPPVEPLCIAQGYPLHDSGQRYVRYLNLEMDVVGHEAECVDLEGDTAAGIFQNRVEAEAVLVVGKDVPTIVASQDYMIYVDAFLSWHGASIPRVINTSIPGPIWP